MGYRALRLTRLLDEGEGKLGLFGFGSSAHMVLQVAVSRGLEVYVFTRSESKRVTALENGRSVGWPPTETRPATRLGDGICSSWVGCSRSIGEAG